jgi:GABA(A) receptor-associated protein
MKMTYKDTKSFEERRKESSRIMLKHPDRIPVICEKNPNSTIKSFHKVKYLVPRDMTIAQFIFVVREKIKIKPEQSIYMLSNNTLLKASSQVGELYSERKDEDGFLYITYSAESTFG